MPAHASLDAPAVSVVVPAYNAERWIGGCVESVLASRLSAWGFEVICVDNGSTDETLKILRSFGARIRLEQAKVRGPGAARNAGLRVARGELVAFTDADCIVTVDWLLNLIEPLRSMERCATGGRIVARPQAGPVERFGELVHNHRQAIERDSPPYLIGMNMAARRELLLSVGGFDERWLRTEDVEITYRLLAAGCRIVYCNDAVIAHHNRDTVPALMREGFLHGYYHPALMAAYGDWARGYRRPGDASSELDGASFDSPDPRLTRRQIDLFWRVFRFAKQVGRYAGTLRPPVRVS